MKNKNGITLIALVITIIVMLILVAVTIRISQEGSLFKHAANAAKGTKTATEGENMLLGGNLGDKTIEEIVAEQTETATQGATQITFTIKGFSNPFTAEQGMTWEEWLYDERFDSNGLRKSQNGIYVVTSENMNVVNSEGSAVGVKLSDTIINNTHYGISDAIK